MPTYDVDWEMQGTAVVEADDPTEARELVGESISNFDVSQLEQWGVDEHEITDVREK